MGQNAVGKTTAFRYLTGVAQQRGIVYDHQPVSDYLFILQQTLMDDKRGGFCHYHNWSQVKCGGHSHENGEPTIPFAVIHNDLVDAMQEELLKTITLLPRLGKLRFVEWTGGINTNPLEEPVSQVDFSFNRVSKKIKENLLGFEWVERVRAVIHISAGTTTRCLFNTKDCLSQSPQILLGQASAKRIPTVLKLFGHDDFAKIEPFFQEAGVPFVFDMFNRGDDGFYEELREISDVIF
jgi:hypothetical protein